MGRKTLEHFYIDDSYGGNQDWFRSFMMRLGGCAAETACDSSLFFALHRDIEGIYPFDKNNLSKDAYVDFAHRMEKYLWPRMSGVNRIDIFIEGYGNYLRECGVERIGMQAFPGSEPYDKAAEALVRQIDAGYPIPTLILNHKDKSMKDYVWHWFLINGYEKQNESDDLLIRTVTYSEYQWISLKRLWDTGHDMKGGFVLYDVK